MPVGPDMTHGTESNRWRWAMSVCLVLWATLWMIGVYPGEMTPDSYAQLQQGKAWKFDSAHPVIFSAVLGLAHRWTGGSAGVFVAQIVLITGALVTLGWSMTQSKRVAKIAFLLLACSPILWAQWAAVWKDVWFSLFLLWSVAFLSLRWFGLAGVALAIMCCFRHNGITVALPLAAYIGFTQYKAGNALRGAIWALTIAAGTVLVPKALDLALAVEEGYPAAPSLVFDVTGAYNFDEEALAEGPFSDVVTYEVVRKKYNPDTARYFTSNRRGVPGLQHKDFDDDESYGVLKSEWARVIREHPRAYISHRLAFARSFFGLWKRPQLGLYAATDRIRRLKDKASWLPRTSYRVIDEFLRPMLAEPFSRAWMWTLVAAFAGWGAWRQRKMFEFALVISAGAYILGNLAIAPSSVVRYHMPTIIMVIVVLPRVLDGWLGVGMPGFFERRWRDLPSDKTGEDDHQMIAREHHEAEGDPLRRQEAEGREHEG